MSVGDVKEVLDMALVKTGVDKVNVRHRPRLLSDNGPCYLSSELKDYLDDRGMDHTRGAPYHPQTQGKIERYHRTMKNVVKLKNPYFAVTDEKGNFIISDVPAGEYEIGMWHKKLKGKGGTVTVPESESVSVKLQMKH